MENMFRSRPAPGVSAQQFRSADDNRGDPEFTGTVVSSSAVLAGVGFGHAATGWILFLCE